MYTKTFKRYEIKYLVHPSQFEPLKAELDKRMVLDQFCVDSKGYMVYSLYFDTDDDSIIRHSLSKPYYKEKLRLRSYALPTSGEEVVFIELKKKIGDIVAKRRTNISYNEAMKFLCGEKTPQADSFQDGQIIREIAGYLGRYQLKPKVYLSYERIAYFDMNNTEFRVSFDKSILTRRNQVNLIDGDFGSELLEDDLYLMEIKCSGQIPLWLCQTLSAMKIFKTSFSKYGEEYKQYVKQIASHNSFVMNQPKRMPEFVYPEIVIPA